MLIFYKSIDYSVLTAGFTIPLSYKNQLFAELGFSLQRGEKKIITILIDGVSYSANITNILFDEKKYPTHDDLLQIRYGKNSPLAFKLREIFSQSKKRLEMAYQSSGSHRISGLKENEKEFIAIYSTPLPGTVLFDCITNSEFQEEATAISSYPEIIAEGILDGTDENSSIVLKTKVCKIRKLTRSIGNDLKKIYGYRCQICGCYIGEPYGSTLIHAHHIDYFTKSLNNNAENIMIVCPNHHGIIHDRNPIFDRNKKMFHYPNGYTEGLTLNLHL